MAAVGLAGAGLAGAGLAGAGWVGAGWGGTDVAAGGAGLRGGGGGGTTVEDGRFGGGGANDAGGADEGLLGTDGPGESNQSSESAAVVGAPPGRVALGGADPGAGCGARNRAWQRGQVCGAPGSASMTFKEAWHLGQVIFTSPFCPARGEFAMSGGVNAVREPLDRAIEAKRSGQSGTLSVPSAPHPEPVLWPPFQVVVWIARIVGPS